MNKDDRIAQIKFSEVYPHYVNKIIKKGRTKHELHKIVTWLTGYNDHTIQSSIERNETFKDFFEKANLNPNRIKITGTICGYRVESIENQLTQNIRYLDKLVDELAKGRPMEKILRE